MSDRRDGWYWVIVEKDEGWEAAKWDGISWHVTGTDMEWGHSMIEIGPRIPTPDEEWQCVPTRRPTIDMIESGMCHVMRGQDHERAQACWRAMLAASPKP